MRGVIKSLTKEVINLVIEALIIKATAKPTTPWDLIKSKKPSWLKYSLVD
jgi:hypothetical protein